MSSYICSPKHFNSIEQAFYMRSMSSDFYFPYSVYSVYPEMKPRAHFTQDRIEQVIHGIINALREMNVLCVTLQYRHHYTGTVDAEIEGQTEYLLKNQKEAENLTDIQLYKALSCLNYQIEEEHLNEIRDFTERERNAMLFLREMKTALAELIAARVPEYEAAKWEID